MKTVNNLVSKFKMNIDTILQNIDLEMQNIKTYFPKKETLFLADKISKCQNNIYILGVGKSETIGIQLCNLLKSIGIKVFTLNVLNALHGDIGTLKENDIVIMFSKSGNTSEIVSLLDYIKLKKCLTWGICCHKESKFKKLCDFNIVIPFIKELENEDIKTLPTNSCFSQLIFCNILTLLVTNISISNYKNNHPAGNIGSNLKTIKECMIQSFPKLILTNNISLQDILLEMTKYSIGCCFFINLENKMVGLLTDGDIRRILVENIGKKFVFEEDLNLNYFYETDLNKMIGEIQNIKRKKFIPVLNSNKEILGIIKF